MDDELLIAYFKGEVSDEEAQQITEMDRSEDRTPTLLPTALSSV